MANMKTVVINGVPYRMRADMKLPWWRSGVAANDAFRQGYLGCLTTSKACEDKRKRVGDGCTPNGRSNYVEWYEAAEERREDWELPLELVGVV